MWVQKHLCNFIYLTTSTSLWLYEHRVFHVFQSRIRVNNANSTQDLWKTDETWWNPHQLGVDPAGLDLVLDLDAADPQQEMVFLLKKLPGHRPNQLWQLQQMGPERYTLRSLCNSLRFMMYFFYIFLCLQYFFIFLILRILRSCSYHLLSRKIGSMPGEDSSLFGVLPILLFINGTTLVPRGAWYKRFSLPSERGFLSCLARDPVAAKVSHGFPQYTLCFLMS